jgi:hypothetical protein
MNPAIFTVLAWEKELELQRQAPHSRRTSRIEILPELRTQPRLPFWARLFPVRPTRPTPVCTK